MSLEEDIQMLDIKVRQLKLEYEQYFLGSRPREPALLRGEIQKQITRFSNDPIQNTALRFKYNSVCSRYMAFKRKWDTNLRKIEAGTYERHVFKAKLHGVGDSAEASPKSAPLANDELFDSYVSAARSCGQNVANLTPEKLQVVVAKQESAIRKKFACKGVNFRVVVEEGRVKLKASPVRGT